MSTKTCKGCGWVYPITQPGTKCKFCGTPFELILCPKCGEVKPASHMRLERGLPATPCLECFRPVIRAGVARFRALEHERMTDRFNSWLKRVKAVPANYPTLTEYQWLEACRFFDGCARCHTKDIDTRGFFISRALGGRYCDWNVIPLCERCAVTWDLNKNVFLYTLNKDYAKSSSRSKYKGHSTTEFRDCLEKIIEYLEVRLDKAAGVQEESTDGQE